MASILVGGLGFLALYFWWSVAFVYAGLILLCVDMWLEPTLALHRWFRALGFGLLVMIGLFFTLGVVLSEETVLIAASARDAPYAPGIAIGGIPWRSEYEDVRVFVNNPTRHDYENVDLEFNATTPIVHIAQLSQFPGVSITPQKAVDLYVQIPGSPENQYFVFPADDHIYAHTVHCDRLPAKATLELVLAAASPEGSAGKDSAGIPVQSTHLTVDVGAPQPTVEHVERYGPKPHLTRIEVTGRFKGSLRMRTIKQTVQLHR